MLQMPLSRSGKCDNRDLMEVKGRESDSNISCTASRRSEMDLWVHGRKRREGKKGGAQIRKRKRKAKSERTSNVPFPSSVQEIKDLKGWIRGTFFCRERCFVLPKYNCLTFYGFRKGPRFERGDFYFGLYLFPISSRESWHITSRDRTLRALIRV